MDASPTPRPPPFVTITTQDGKFQLQTNLAPELKPMILWFLEQAKLMVLTQPSDKEHSSVIAPGNGLAGLMKRMRR